VIVTLEAAAGAVYVVWQEPALALVDESEQAVGLNEPPAPPSVQVTLPVGVVGEPIESLAVAVNVIARPAVAEAGFGETVVVVECGVPQFKTAVSVVSLVIDTALRYVVLPESSQRSKEQDPKPSASTVYA
jgi:hypothetical protein